MVAVFGRTREGDFVEVGRPGPGEPGPGEVPGMLVVRPDGSLFFGNADRALARRRTSAPADQRTGGPGQITPGR
jgi:MFS superfamily sulfate permease-like transporter